MNKINANMVADLRAGGARGQSLFFHKFIEKFINVDEVLEQDLKKPFSKVFLTEIGKITVTFTGRKIKVYAECLKDVKWYVGSTWTVMFTEKERLALPSGA